MNEKEEGFITGVKQERKYTAKVAKHITTQVLRKNFLIY